MKLPPWYEHTPHITVLYQEIIQAIEPKNGGRYVDATLGAGGHAWGILESSKPGGKLLGLDVDQQALDIAREHLEEFQDRVILRHASYTTLDEQLTQLNWDAVDGIVIDLGVSSMQLDNQERGFSFQTDAPLDMRFDAEQPLTAAHIINNMSESELSELIWRYGDEIKHKQIAHAIQKAKPLETTSQLSEVIKRALKGKSKQRIHPATRTFQAIRIAVNQELSGLEKFLPLAVAALVPGGRLAIISFHSLEDRIVKHFFRKESRDCICPPHQPICTCQHRATIQILTRRPLLPTQKEVLNNSRARSARLRIAQKIINSTYP